MSTTGEPGPNAGGENKDYATFAEEKPKAKPDAKSKSRLMSFYDPKVHSPPPVVHIAKAWIPLAWKHPVIKSFTVIYLGLLYIAYHMSRLPFSIAKTVLHYNCTPSNDPYRIPDCGWAPFDKDNYAFLFGVLDCTFTFTYALSLMVISGPLAERLRPRAFLFLGMLLSGVATALFGLGYYLEIHSLVYYVFVMILLGIFQSTGYPTSIAVLTEWTEPETRGRTIGIWSVSLFAGNILGALVPGHYVSIDWGMAFFVPGLCMVVLALTTPFLLVAAPREAGLCRDGSVLADKQPVIVTTSSSVKPAEEESPLVSEQATPEGEDEREAINFLAAIQVSGVIEFSMCLFFTKLVSYTALYWLPKMMAIKGFSPQNAAYLTSVFDAGGMAGALVAGLIGDSIGVPAIMITVSLLCGIGPLYLLSSLNGYSAVPRYILFLLLGGIFVNGPYAYIAGVISSKKGENSDIVAKAQKATSTICGIMDGIGSIGGAIGPLLAGYLAGIDYDYIIYIFIISLILGSLVLLRQTFHDFKGLECLTRLRNLWTKISSLFS